ncbi:hypothetical protein H5410_027224 [Solanum commersonii]|uniref:Uncharacterized protein n=1 Tax=Solanum commersonii TaxID=4109 RepID=A0A9J5Z2U0_SOLCO|nr:hypothetical protein H5410_027224 [Solanum commersonii]
MMRMIRCCERNCNANMETYFQCKLHDRSTIHLKDFDLVHAIARMHETSLNGGLVKMFIYDPSTLL